jgi:uncharacterized membrane protein SpoIIM required for sporulation
MNRRIPSVRDAVGGDAVGLILVGALFVCGCIAGATAAGLIPSADGLRAYLADTLPINGGGAGSFFGALFTAGKYHLAALFFAFSLLGVVCVPIVSAVRGFFLCFSVSCVVRLFGADGVLLALTMLAPGALVAVPCFFIVASQSFSSSLRLLSCTRAPGAALRAVYGGAFFRRVAVCAAMLCLSAALDVFVVSPIVGRLASELTF